MLEPIGYRNRVLDGLTVWAESCFRHLCHMGYSSSASSLLSLVLIIFLSIFCASEEHLLKRRYINWRLRLRLRFLVYLFSRDTIDAFRSACIGVSLALFVSLDLSLSLCLPRFGLVSGCIFASLSLFMSVFVCLGDCSSVCLCVCFSVYHCIWLSVCSSVFLSLFWRFCICLFVCPFVWLFLILCSRLIDYLFSCPWSCNCFDRFFCILVYHSLTLSATILILMVS